MLVSPYGIPIQDFFASVSPCLCPPRRGRGGKSHVLSSLQPLVPLFALFSAPLSFVFNRLQPLFPKHPGWGVRRLGASASAPAAGWQIQVSARPLFSYSYESIFPQLLSF